VEFIDQLGDYRSSRKTPHQEITGVVCIKGKVKVLPTLFLTEHHTMKACWRSGGISPHIHDIGTKLR
jgi:hypothetical protein